jgi:hypothetical protein
VLAADDVPVRCSKVTAVLQAVATEGSAAAAAECKAGLEVQVGRAATGAPQRQQVVYDIICEHALLQSDSALSRFPRLLAACW